VIWGAYCAPCIFIFSRSWRSLGAEEGCESLAPLAETPTPSGERPGFRLREKLKVNCLANLASSYIEMMRPPCTTIENLIDIPTAHYPRAIRGGEPEDSIRRKCSRTTNASGKVRQDGPLAGSSHGHAEPGQEEECAENRTPFEPALMPIP